MRHWHDARLASVIGREHEKTVLYHAIMTGSAGHSAGTEVNEMMKMQVEMKNDADGKLRELVDHIAERSGLVKQDDGMYIPKNEDQDFVQITIFIDKVRKENWFRDNVDTWLWYDNDGNINGRFDVDDVKTCFFGKYIESDSYVRAS
jgi:hypothetical protein